MGHVQALLLFGCSGIVGYHCHHRRLLLQHNNQTIITMQFHKSVMPVLKRRNSVPCEARLTSIIKQLDRHSHKRNFSYSRLVRIQEPATARGPEQQSAHTFTAVVTRNGASSQPQNSTKLKTTVSRINVFSV